VNIMSMLDIAGGAALSGVVRRGGLSPLALGLLAWLAYRAYRKRDRMADMLGGAMAGMGKLPAMALPLLTPKLTRKSRPVRKRRMRRRSGNAHMRRSSGSHPIGSHVLH
jgi:hypothetical protein